MVQLAIAAGACAWIGCGSSSSPNDGGLVDAGQTGNPQDSGADAGTPDAGSGDAGLTDAGTPDAGLADAGPASTDAGVWAGAVKVLADQTYAGGLTATVGDIHVAGDGFGNAIALWSQNMPDAGVSPTYAYVLYTSTYRADAGWDLPKRLDLTDPAAAAGAFSVLNMFPDIAFDSAGNAVATWIQLDWTTGSNQLWVARYSPSAGWATPLVANASNSSVPVIAVESSGTAYLGLVQPTPSIVYVIRSFTDGGFSTPAVVESVSAAQPRLTTTPDGGTVLIAYSAADSSGHGERLLRTATQLPDAGWTTPVTVGITYDAGSVLPLHFEFQLAASSNGTALLLWTQQLDDGVTTRVEASHYAGGTWSPSMDVGASVPGRAMAPSVGMDNSGNAIATWIQVDGGIPGTMVYANRYVAGSGWATPVQLSSNPGGVPGQLDTIASIAPSGSAVALYSRGATTSARVYAARWTGTAWLPEENIDTTDPTYSVIHSATVFLNTRNAAACWTSPTSVLGIWAHNTTAANAIPNVPVTIYANHAP